MIYVRVRSHRAREKMERAIGRLPQGYFIWDSPGEFREITEDEFEKVKAIKGITLARVQKYKLMRCWSFSDAD